MISRVKKKILKIIFLVIPALLAVMSEGQTIFTEFGKNRVQYHDDFNDWWSYDTDHYTVFWYGKERNLAKTAIMLTQISYDDIEDILDFKMNKKIMIIVYSNLSDLNQSNLGIKGTEEDETPGITRFYENKVLVYFNGDHEDLLLQIREGTSKVFLQNMFGGLSYENIYKKLMISSFPKWFTDGSTDFLTDKWNFHDDAILRMLFATKKSTKMDFKNISSKLPALSGKSFFHFLEQSYGKAKISDFYYLMRISRDINSSLQTAFSKPVKSLFKEWKDFYQLRYKNEELISSEFQSASHKELKKTNVPFSTITQSPKHNAFAYVSNKKGRAEVFLNDGKNTKRIFKLGYVNTAQQTDYSYPLIFFNDSGSEFSIIYQKRNILILRIFNVKDHKYEDHIISPEYRKIYSASVIDDDNFLLNADIDGYNDLFSYNIRKKQTVRYTEDFWDDLDGKKAVLGLRSGIVFASNRNIYTSGKQIFDSIPPLGKFDIFFLDFNDKSIVNLTSTPDIDERNPDILNDILYFISDESGIRNIKTKNLKSSEEELFFTNSQTGISNFSLNNRNLIFSTQQLCDNFLVSIDIPGFSQKSIPLTSFKKSVNNPKKTELQVNLNQSLNDDIEIDSGLFFQSIFRDEKPEPLKFEKKVSGNSAVFTAEEFKFKPFESYKAIASRLKFSFSEIIYKVDNEPLFDGLETYSTEQNSFAPIVPGLLVKSIVKDMFEDHYIETGLRFASDFNQKEYFWVYENLKTRIDWQYAFYRKSRSDYDFSRTNIVDKIKQITNLVQVQAKYSFDVYQSFKLITRVHSEKALLGASDTFSLNNADITEQRISLRSEYVFDNTSVISPNLLEGNRSKIFFEAYNRFNFNIKSIKDFDISSGLMGVIGFDSRQYFKFLDKSIAAFRLSGQTSFGNENNLYILGGVENWYFANQSDLVPYPESDNFAFKIQAANLRGFGYNARNGSSFLVFNSELRFPVFQYLLGQNVKKSFFRDFQLTLFYDMGLAWVGKSPFSENNPANYKVIDIPPSIKLKIRYYSDPLIAGYGFGARTSLLGYFIKFDFAWGIETRKIYKPKLFFSVGYDF